MGVMKKIAFLNVISSITWNATPFMVSAFTFGLYLFIDKNNSLDANKAFVSLSLFNALKYESIYKIGLN
jgi:hypothetical protein